MKLSKSSWVSLGVVLIVVLCGGPLCLFGSTIWEAAKLPVIGGQPDQRFQQVFNAKVNDTAALLLLAGVVIFFAVLAVLIISWLWPRSAAIDGQVPNVSPSSQSRDLSTNKTNPTRPLTILILVLIVVLFIICLGVSTTQPKTGTQSSVASIQHRLVSIGEEGTLTFEGATQKDNIIVAADEATLDEATHALLIKDMPGIMDLALQGRAFLVPVGTRVKVLDFGGFLSRKAKIRIMEGDMLYRAGWVLEEWIRQ